VFGLLAILGRGEEAGAQEVEQLFQAGEEAGEEGCDQGV